MNRTITAAIPPTTTTSTYMNLKLLPLMIIDYKSRPISYHLFHNLMNKLKCKINISNDNYNTKTTEHSKSDFL